MNEILCDQFLKVSIKKIIERYNSCIFIFHGIKGIGKRSFADLYCQRILELNKSEKLHESEMFRNKFT